MQNEREMCMRCGLLMYMLVDCVLLLECCPRLGEHVWLQASTLE